MSDKQVGPLIFVLTGAGISAESGIQTFRDQNGLWENHRIEEVATPGAFRKDPELVHRFYNLRRAQLLSPSLLPNQAHEALAQLEQEFPGEVVLVTQNIDNLHERAGSKNILHMHGELLKMRCVQTGKIFEIRSDILAQSECDCCGQQGTLRPHIVWFGEMPFHMDVIYNHLSRVDVFISIGTSGQVYPAAQFVAWARYGSRKIEVNIKDTDISGAFDEHRVGAACEQVPLLVEELLRTYKERA